MGNDSDGLHLSRSAPIGPQSVIRGGIIRCSPSASISYGALSSGDPLCETPNSPPFRHLMTDPEHELSEGGIDVNGFPDDGFMVAWSIEPEPVIEVGSWPDGTGWSDRYQCTTGCCDAFFQSLARAERAQALVNLAAGLMFEGVRPLAVLGEFAKLALWRDMSVILPAGRLDRAFLPGWLDWNPHNGLFLDDRGAREDCLSLPARRRLVLDVVPVQPLATWCST